MNRNEIINGYLLAVLKGIALGTWALLLFAYASNP